MEYRKGLCLINYTNKKVTPPFSKFWIVNARFLFFFGWGGGVYAVSYELLILIIIHPQVMGNTLGEMAIRELVYVPSSDNEEKNNSITIKLAENGPFFDKIRYENGSTVTYRWNATQASKDENKYTENCRSSSVLMCQWAVRMSREIKVKKL